MNCDFLITLTYSFFIFLNPVDLYVLFGISFNGYGHLYIKLQLFIGYVSVLQVMHQSIPSANTPPWGIFLR